MPSWVPVLVAVPCWVAVPCLIAVCGGGFVVVVVEALLTGKTCLVEVFAFVLTSVFAGISAGSLLIAAALICSDFDTCGATPV